MGNLKDIQDITGLTSEAIFNIRKPVDYMCSDIDSHIKDIRTQCDYIMDGDEEDVKYYSKSIKSDVDSYFEDIRSKVENLRDWGEQWKALAKDLFNELLELVGILSKYVNKFDKRDKMYLVGYNNAGFDNNFLRALFTQCGDKYFGSWFYPNCMDVYVMVTPFLMGVRNDMENFKLMTVARTMGIEIDENKLHDATYDIELTRDIFYKIINKMDVKL